MLWLRVFWRRVRRGIPVIRHEIEAEARLSRTERLAGEIDLHMRARLEVLGARAATRDRG